MSILSEKTTNIALSIMESVELSDYSKDDFVEVAYSFFRSWVSENYGEEKAKYPISYLDRKLGSNFINFLEKNSNININKVSRYGSNSLVWSELGLELVKNSLVSLKNFGPEKSWFDIPGNQKRWDSAVKYLDLPPYLYLSVTEERPNFIIVEGNIDFVEYIHSPIVNTYNSVPQIIVKLKFFLEKYAGVEMGKPSFNQLHMTYKNGVFTYVGFEKWNQTVFNKVLKPEIKNLPDIDIRSIVCKVSDKGNSERPTIVIRTHKKYQFSKKKIVDDYLKSKGYGPENLPVDIS